MRVEIVSDLLQSFNLNCSVSSNTDDFSCLLSELYVTDLLVGEDVPSAMATVDCRGPC